MGVGQPSNKPKRSENTLKMISINTLYSSWCTPTLLESEQCYRCAWLAQVSLLFLKVTGRLVYFLSVCPGAFETTRNSERPSFPAPTCEPNVSTLMWGSLIGGFSLYLLGIKNRVNKQSWHNKGFFLTAIEQDSCLKGASLSLLVQ